jgi:hypothetical protein
MYDLALSAGASGGKICGAGGGGFLLLYCDPAHHKAVRKAMEAYRELPIALDPDGSKIIFQNRSRIPHGEYEVLFGRVATGRRHAADLSVKVFR